MRIKGIVKNVDPKTKVGKVYIRLDLYEKDAPRRQLFWKTELTVEKEKFKNGLFLGNSLEAQDKNASLNQEILDLRATAKELEKKGIPITKTTINQFKNPEKEVQKSLLDYLNDYKDYQEINGKNQIAIKTKTLINHFENFSKSTEYYSQLVDQAFIDSFANYMININLHPNTVHRHFKNLRSFFKYLKSYHQIQVAEDLKYPKEVDTEKTFLTRDEIRLLIDFNPATEKLKRVKKLMVIQIYTGLRYSDLKRLNRSHIQGRFIKMKMQKVTKPVIIPMDKNLVEVLESIDYQVKNIIISNQKYNDYIKELAKLAKIDTQTEWTQYKNGVKYFESVPKYELLASHNLRTTFVTLAIQSGMKLPLIMQITGHRKISTLQVYSKVIDEYVVTDYENFSNYLSS